MERLASKSRLLDACSRHVGQPSHGVEAREGAQGFSFLRNIAVVGFISSNVQVRL